MTVTTEITHNTYTGDGAQTTFPYLFPIQASTDLEVYLDGMLQVGGYSVTGVGSASGTVIFTTAPFASVAVILLRNTPATQPTTFSDFSNYPASAVNGAFDRVTMATQQASADVDRALKADLDDTVGTLPSAATRADMGLGFDSSGDPIAIPLTSIANAIPITEKAAALGVATLDASARPVQALAALNGKAINLAADTNLQTWADTFPVSGLYDIDLTVAQGNLPAGWWYIELVRHTGDASGNVYHSMRATSLTGTANVVYLNTNISGTWSGWEKAKGLVSLNGKAIQLTADTNLQTWADTLPDSGLYNLYLSVAQGNLPIGWWYIEFIRHSDDSSSNLVHHMRATTLAVTTNITYVNTRVAAGWSGWKDTRALGDGQTWKDKTASYLNNVTYTNNYGRTIALFARAEATATSAFGIDTYINGFDAVKQTQYSPAAGYHAISFVIVPDGQTFKFSTAVNLNFVSELS